jgi:hypothetical protein
MASSSSPSPSPAATAASNLPPRNRLARALHNLDDEQLAISRERFVGTGAMSAIMQVELQREEQRRRALRSARGELLPASAGARALASAPSNTLPPPSATTRRRRKGNATTRSSDTSSSSSSEDEEEEDDDDYDDDEAGLSAWLATGSGALWLADQLGECLETASAGLGSVDDALRLKFRRLRRKAAAAFATGAGPFAMPVVFNPPADEGEGEVAAPSPQQRGGGQQQETESLVARLKRRVRAKLLPAPVAGALNAVGVSAEEYFATGQPLPLPFLVEKFIQRRAKVWVRRNLRGVFLIGGLAACASTLLVANAKAIALGVASVAPPLPLPRPRNVWRRVLGRRTRKDEPPPPLLYPYEIGDAVGAVLDAAVAPGFLGPWIAIYVALRLIVGPDDHAAAAEAARQDKAVAKRRRRLRREQRRQGRRQERREEEERRRAKEGKVAATPATKKDDNDDNDEEGAGSEYGWV